MQEQTVHDFERGLLDVLVGAVDRIARLECDDALPAARREHLARFLGCMAEFDKLAVVRHINQPHLTRQVDVALRVEPRHAGMAVLVGAVHARRLVHLVVLVLVREFEQADDVPIRLDQRHIVPETVQL